MQGLNRTNKYAELRRQIEIENLAHSKDKRIISRKKGSIVSLCVSFLCCCISFFITVGSTYAWFTDTVSSVGNRVKAGTLNVDLLMYDETESKYISIADGAGDIFTEANVAQDSNSTLWEPGKTQVVYLAVKNEGNLALKYNIVFNITDGGLADSLEYYVGDGIENGDAIDNWDTLKTAGKTNNLGYALNNDGVVTAFTDSKLLPYSIVEEVETGIDYFAFAIHMNEDAPIETMDKAIIFDVSVLATQCSEENDAYTSNSYDSSSEYLSVENIKHINNIDTLKYVISIGGIGILENDIDNIDEDINVSDDIIINMNGHNIIFINDHLFNVDEGKTITLRNSSETSVDKVSVNVNSRLVISSEDSGKFNN